MRPFASLCVVCAFLLLSSTPAAAQAPRNPTDVIAQGTSYHVFALPGEATIELLVLGNAASGVYVVGETTSLTELLALAGGAGGNDQNTTATIERTVRLLREQGGQRVVVYEAELNEMLRAPSAHPALMDGDMLTVETEVHNRFNLVSTLSIVTSLTSVTLLILRIVDSN